MQTSETIAHSPISLISLGVPSLVQAPVSQGNEPDLPIQNQLSGESPSGSSVLLSQGLWLWNSLKDLSDEDFALGLEQCEWLDTLASLQSCYQRRKLERPKGESGYLLCPTPTASDPKGDNKYRQAGGSKFGTWCRNHGLVNGDSQVLNAEKVESVQGFQMGHTRVIGECQSDRPDATSDADSYSVRQLSQPKPISPLPSFESLQPMEADIGKEVYIDVVEKRGAFKGGIHKRIVKGKTITFGIVQFPDCPSQSLFPIEEIELVPETEKATATTAANQSNTQGDYTMVAQVERKVFDIEDAIAKYESELAQLIMRASCFTKDTIPAAKRANTNRQKQVKGVIRNLQACKSFPRNTWVEHEYKGKGRVLDMFIDSREVPMLSVVFDNFGLEDISPYELKLACVEGAKNHIIAPLESTPVTQPVAVDEQQGDLNEWVNQVSTTYQDLTALTEVEESPEITTAQNEPESIESLASIELCSRTKVEEVEAITSLSIAEIRRDGGTQQREKIDLVHVKRLVEELKNGVELDPVVVFCDGSEYWLADGFHRCKAYEDSGIEDILCVVHAGTRRDAVLYSVGANADHKAVLPRTRADKRRAALTLLNDPEWQHWSDREIAKRCSVSGPFVSDLRKQSANVSRSDSSASQDICPAPQTRTFTRKGKTSIMRVDGINQNRAASEQTEQQAESQTQDYLIGFLSNIDVLPVDQLEEARSRIHKRLGKEESLTELAGKVVQNAQLFTAEESRLMVEALTAQYNQEAA